MAHHHHFILVPARLLLSVMLITKSFVVESPDPSDSLALVANFTFVARDSKTGKSALVNQISPETEKEKLLWKEADERNKMRKKKREQKLEIEDHDKDRLNTLLAEGRIFCDMPALADRDSILIRDTYLENSFVCQPQQRNIHGRIFGGFLMRRAFELAFSTTYSFAGVAPHFLEVDHVDFFKPVSSHPSIYIVLDISCRKIAPEQTLYGFTKIQAKDDANLMILVELD